MMGAALSKVAIAGVAAVVFFVNMQLATLNMVPKAWITGAEIIGGRIEYTGVLRAKTKESPVKVIVDNKNKPSKVRISYKNKDISFNYEHETEGDITSTDKQYIDKIIDSVLQHNQKKIHPIDKLGQATQDAISKYLKGVKRGLGKKLMK